MLEALATLLNPATCCILKLFECVTVNLSSNGADRNLGVLDRVYVVLNF